MWIVSYEHKHGTDLWVTDTKDAAIRTCCWAVLDYLDEIEDDAVEDKILGLVKRRQILDVCLQKDVAERWKGPRGAERWTNVRIYKRMARAENLGVVVWIVVADEAKSHG